MSTESIVGSPRPVGSARLDEVNLNFEDRMRESNVGVKFVGWLAAILYPCVGMLALLGAWWMGGRWIAGNPDLSAFSDFSPGPTFVALGSMWKSGSLLEPIMPSLMRIGKGMFWATILGVPIGIAVGRVKSLQRTANMPMQFLRMISPLAWMPIAVMVFETWEGSIVFLLAAACIWPIVFSTSNGLSKIDPDWFAVARNLGAKPYHLLLYVILPATAQDILTGLRLALGVAWIVLVPAEFLGVTSGLGYSINDAATCLEYDRLAATVLVIGVLGYLLDFRHAYGRTASQLDRCAQRSVTHLCRGLHSNHKLFLSLHETEETIMSDEKKAPCEEGPVATSCLMPIDKGGLEALIKKAKRIQRR